MEVTGKIKLVGETETFGSSGFRKRNLVVTTSEQYPQDIQIEFVQDKVDILNKYKVGQDVKIGINLRGREWINPEGVAKYFNSIQGWRIENVELEAGTQEVVTSDSEPDDLPFNYENRTISKKK